MGNCLVVSPSFDLSRRRCCYAGIGKIGSVEKYYEVGEEVGKGQFGVIKRCINRSTGIVYACKSIAKTSTTAASMCWQEIQCMHSLAGQPNIAQLKEVLEDERHVHLVMELCEGGELFERILSQKWYPEKEAVPIMKTLVEVIQCCHEKGIMHRDLKPENILFLNHSPSSPIKLIDFGLAQNFSKGQKFMGMAGSVHYIAPEILNGEYSEEVDVWSAGVILYLMLSGTFPFWGETDSEIFDAIQLGHLDFTSELWRHHISTEAKDLVQRMLSHCVKKRITPKEILRHPWIVAHMEQNNNLAHVKLASNGGQRKSSKNNIASLVDSQRPIPLQGSTLQHHHGIHPCIKSTLPSTHFLPSKWNSEEWVNSCSHVAQESNHINEVIVRKQLEHAIKRGAVQSTSRHGGEDFGCSYVVIKSSGEEETLLVESKGINFLVVVDCKRKHFQWRCLDGYVDDNHYALSQYQV